MINLIKETFIRAITSDYFYLRQRIPIFVYVFYIHFKKSKSPKIKGAVRTIISFIILGTCYAMGGIIFHFKFESIIPLGWGYPGLVTWGIFFVVYYEVLIKKNYNELTAFSLATLATVGGGWLYEISFFRPLELFLGPNTIFYINGQILCILFLGYELSKMGFKVKKLSCVGFGFFAFTWIMFYLNFWDLVLYFNVLTGSSYTFQWIYRVPTCIFLISLLEGVKIGNR